MSLAEMVQHGRRRILQAHDSRRPWFPDVNLGLSPVFPRLPDPDTAPPQLRQALKHDVEDILAGRWKAFGHIDLIVDDPPKWHFDYLVRRDCGTQVPAFQLQYRSLPGGADIKLIWELSRWHQLVRLAMGWYVLDDHQAARKCLQWLESWMIANPPYRGWNWTSALEVGIRLIQFTWIDALFTVPREGQGRPPLGPEDRQRFIALRTALLPAHISYAWRYRSFGSSANNHLLGELAGCILAIVRWPGLAQIAAPLEQLQAYWQHEVLSQFAEDGGNKEQALNYHLFSLELCLHTLAALQAAGHEVSPAVQERLALAAEFFPEVQVRRDPWDYGDSDDAFVTPFFAADAIREWREWLERPVEDSALHFWLAPATSRPRVELQKSPTSVVAVQGWSLHPHSGIARRDAGPWWLRWDLSALGYLSTAAHAHLDALHLSIWLDGRALVVDPGTGAYYADHRVRNWLASRAAHNGPCPLGPEEPERRGPFLWTDGHSSPSLASDGNALVAVLELPSTKLHRRISELGSGQGWEIEDVCLQNGNPAPFTVRWQFAPGCRLRQLSAREFAITRDESSAFIRVSPNWDAVNLLLTNDHDQHLHAAGPASKTLEGIVSPSFRKLCHAPLLRLTANSATNRNAMFRTTFLTSEP